MKVKWKYSSTIQVTQNLFMILRYMCIVISINANLPLNPNLSVVNMHYRNSTETHGSDNPQPTHNTDC